MFNIPENTLPCSFQTPLPVPTEVTSTWGVTDLPKEGDVCWSLFLGKPVEVMVREG